MRRRCSLASAVGHSVCLALLAALPAVSQNPPLEYQVKAAFLYNFLKYVDWPKESFTRPDTPYTICLAGDPFQGAVEQTVEGERLDGRPIVVRRIAPGGSIRDCHLIHVSLSERRREAEIINAAKNLPILTVGEVPDFIDLGGMIRFTTEIGRVKFEINPDAAERASLRMSSRLLRLAVIVRPKRANRGLSEGDPVSARSEKSDTLTHSLRET